MRWSFKIARVSGIDIRVHLTFFIILFWGATQFGRFGLPGVLFGIALVLLLFLCVTLHELGHSVVAQRFGIHVPQIVLLPIGGVAMLQRMPKNPWQELWIALAGPVVNVVIAGALILGLLGRATVTGMNFNDLLTPAQAGPSGVLMLRWLLQANIALVVFNMLPAFPLDGGRVLRSILAMRMHHQRATETAAIVGQVIAVLLGLLGLMTGNVMLVIIALFIFFGAGAEQVEGRARSVLAGHRVGDAYNRGAYVAHPYDRLNSIVHRILNSYQPDFAIVNGHDLVGVVTRAEVMRALSTGVGDVPIGQIMAQAPVPRVQADQTLEQVRETLAERSARVAAVYDGPQFLGLVSMEDIDEAFALLQFIDGHARRATRAPTEDGSVVV